MSSPEPADKPVKQRSGAVTAAAIFIVAIIVVCIVVAIVIRVSGGAGVGFNRSAEEKRHTCPKPLNVMREILVRFVEPGSLVLDPFTGSGTTGVAALREGFRFVGIEREAQYVEIARARIANEADPKGQSSLL